MAPTVSCWHCRSLWRLAREFLTSKCTASWRPILKLASSQWIQGPQLELTKHITSHANGEPLLKWSSSHSHILPQFCNDSACCLVCQQQRQCSYFKGKFQGQFTTIKSLPYMYSKVVAYLIRQHWQWVVHYTVILFPPKSRRGISVLLIKASLENGLLQDFHFLLRINCLLWAVVAMELVM